MLTVSVRQFRIVCSVALVSLALLFLPRLGLISFSEGVAVARQWRYFEALLPHWAIWTYAAAWFTAVMVSLVGMYRFWRLSRWCLIVTWLGALFFRPLLGLSVYWAYEAFLATLFGSALLWLIIVSFWSP